MAQRLKHPPAMWETWVRSLGQEDPLENEMATMVFPVVMYGSEKAMAPHSSTLA